MATTESDGDAEPYIGGRVTEDLKRLADMRARQLGMNTSEYLRKLIRDDLSDVEWAESVRAE